ncbi:MAG: hypothetical protein D6711_11660 [Chloroflexi bacterium]|nr:MAG: hypothetical protein D6711_11660 [Chloroflexota bacterium]
MDVLIASILVVVMFNLLRQLQRWLHQHIFKVGWLITKNFYTTTLLYYAFFLPGVFLNQLVYWLTAGMLDVRADRAIHMPQKQEIGELRLDFIRVSKKASPVKLALIEIAPFLAGLAFVLLIADHVFNISQVVVTAQSGTLDSVRVAINQLINVPDFWLWAYLLFTITNTMMPEPDVLRKWWWLFGILVLAMIPLFIIGVGDEIIGAALAGPVITVLNTLSAAFTVMIFFNIIGVILLALIENTIEYITGDSATFKNGKMVVMTREEMLAERKKERKRKQRNKQSERILPPGTPSIYKLSLPIPGAPGEEPVTKPVAAIIEKEKTPEIEPPKRQEPRIITMGHQEDDTSS